MRTEKHDLPAPTLLKPDRGLQLGPPLPLPQVWVVARPRDGPSRPVGQGGLLGGVVVVLGVSSVDPDQCLHSLELAVRTPTEVMEDMLLEPGPKQHGPFHIIFGHAIPSIEGKGKEYTQRVKVHCRIPSPVPGSRLRITPTTAGRSTVYPGQSMTIRVYKIAREYGIQLRTKQLSAQDVGQRIDQELALRMKEYHREIDL